MCLVIAYFIFSPKCSRDINVFRIVSSWDSRHWEHSMNFPRKQIFGECPILAIPPPFPKRSTFNICRGLRRTDITQGSGRIVGVGFLGGVSVCPALWPSVQKVEGLQSRNDWWCAKQERNDICSAHSSAVLAAKWKARGKRAIASRLSACRSLQTLVARLITRRNDEDCQGTSSE